MNVYAWNHKSVVKSSQDLQYAFVVHAYMQAYNSSNKLSRDSNVV